MNEFFKFLPDTTTFPVIFAGHGNPMNALEKNEFTQNWSRIADEIPTPSLILSISAHWESRGTKINSQEWPSTIHDFGGFPRELYEVQYPVKGHPEFSKDLLHKIGIDKIEETAEWGLDHGTWSVLMHFYPEANVPVVQLSLNRNFTPAEHYQFAKNLGFLRNKGVLIFASGNIVHNLREVNWQKSDFGFDWAMTAREKINNLILSGNHLQLVDYKNLGIEVNLAAPTAEHFLPLLYTLAVKTENEPIEFFNDKLVMGSLSMTGIKIG